MFLLSSNETMVKFRLAVFVLLYLYSLEINGDFIKPCSVNDEVKFVCRPDTNISCYDKEMVKLKLTKLDGVKVCRKCFRFKIMKYVTKGK